MSKKLLQAAAGAAAGEALYVEDVFSTYLYTGNGSTQSITNGIDLSGEGGMVFICSRNAGSGLDNGYYDTDRGATKYISSSGLGAGNDAETTDTDTLTAFNSDGFSIGADTKVNNSGDGFLSLSFRKCPGFFTTVTYTGNGTSQNISHDLGSAPAVIWVRNLNGGDWATYHAYDDSVSVAENRWMNLNYTSASSTLTTVWNQIAPTSTQFSVGSRSNVNASGDSFVAYLFADNVAEFGADSDESIIKCGSFTESSNLDVSIGWEPQFLLLKYTGTAGWVVYDFMRGFSYNKDAYMTISSGAGESANPANYCYKPTSDGFQCPASAAFGSGAPCIYIAIRRPMKTPESGTEVFYPTGNSLGSTIVTTGFPSDMVMQYVNSSFGTLVETRLVSDDYRLQIPSTAAETTSLSWDAFSLSSMNKMTQTYFNYVAAPGTAGWAFKRATGFFDVVAYSGNSTAGHEIKHNLGVAPEFMIQKVRNDTTSSWYIYHKDLNVDGDGLAETDTMRLYLDSAAFDYPVWNDTAPTSTSFYLGGGSFFNQTGDNYITYLFATLAGVSKVGSYTGTGSNVDVDCGFSAGARFILIKRTDSTGGWYVYDSERGIVAGNDPYLLLNSTAAEVTTTDYIDPLSSGFTVTSSAPAALNDSGGTYIFLAIS